MSEEDLWMALRGLVARGLVRVVNDGGAVQTVDVATHAGIERSGIEVLMPFGLAARPLAGLTVLLAVGGDQGDMVALPVADPAQRFGGLAAGETVLYDAGGNRVALRAGGIVEVLAATKVIVRAPRCEIEAADGCRITGDVEIVGSLVVSGQVSDAAGSMQEMRDTYNSHTHGGPGPSPTMS